MFNCGIEHIPVRIGERNNSTIIEDDTEKELEWECKMDLKTYINGTK